MTRSLVIIVGIIIALGLGLHFYAQWEMKRFEASLPKPPAPNDAATKGTADAENTIENQEKFDAETGEEHRHGDKWHATPHPSELASDETQEQPVPEGRSQNVEEAEPIADPVAAQLHAEKLKLAQLHEEIDDMGNGFYNALETQSISVDEANAIFEELNGKLQHLREQRRQWLRAYAEHHGTEYQGPEYWANPQMIDEAAIQEQIEQQKEQVEQETQEYAASRGYIILPGTNP
jgi:hypothetical protein